MIAAQAPFIPALSRFDCMDIARTFDLSIIIISYNTCNLLDECLASTFAQPCRLALEVIVVDNASSDGSPMYLADAPVEMTFTGSFSQGLELR